MRGEALGAVPPAELRPRGERVNDNIYVFRSRLRKVVISGLLSAR
jgi:hypothetical protein